MHAEVWSVTSWTTLRRDAMDADARRVAGVVQAAVSWHTATSATEHGAASASVWHTDRTER
ncbi:hypothetical protein GCM10010129_70060 [Streptomyces fumigatiscleroticus]|nr:hypothetical protein GCM10010129_70060 [Streptomyces fumigatiscleroticus]